MNLSEQCSENIVTIVFKVIEALVASVAVISIKTFLVDSLILEWSPFMIGGRDKTVPVVIRIRAAAKRLRLLS